MLYIPHIAHSRCGRNSLIYINYNLKIRIRTPILYMLIFFKPRDFSYTFVCTYVIFIRYTHRLVASFWTIFKTSIEKHCASSNRRASIITSTVTGARLFYCFEIKQKKIRRQRRAKVYDTSHLEIAHDFRIKKNPKQERTSNDNNKTTEKNKINIAARHPCQYWY